MSVFESANVEALLEQVKGWTSSGRLRLARRILESLEVDESVEPTRARSPRGLLGMLKTDGAPPTDEE
ncbi:MAG: hypothetical protein U0835_24960 [Isosphaeraceae bacterium]